MALKRIYFATNRAAIDEPATSFDNAPGDGGRVALKHSVSGGGAGRAAEFAQEAKGLSYSAASFSAAFSASITRALASTRPTMWSTMDTPSTVWSILPAA